MMMILEKSVEAKARHDPPLTTLASTQGDKRPSCYPPTPASARRQRYRNRLQAGPVLSSPSRQRRRLLRSPRVAPTGNKRRRSRKRRRRAWRFRASSRQERSKQGRDDQPTAPSPDRRHRASEHPRADNVSHSKIALISGRSSPNTAPPITPPRRMATGAHAPAGQGLAGQATRLRHPPDLSC